MKYIYLTLPILICLALTNLVFGQSQGSVTTREGLEVSGGTSLAEISETLFIGPGSYEIEGTWEIYSKNVVIDPSAIISGDGIIKFYNPSLAGGSASPTLIDGNGSTHSIDVNIEHYNQQGIELLNMDFPAELVSIGFTNTQNSNLYIGKSLSLETDGAHVVLGIDVQGDLIFDSDATIENYRSERMVVSNNKIVSHLVKEGAGLGFIFPIGKAEGDYTPAKVTGTGTYHLSVQDYAGSVSNEGVLNGGPNRTWHIYSNATQTATIELQHNTNTETGNFSSTQNHFITQYNGSTWSVNPPLAGSPGTFTTGSLPTTGTTSTQKLAGASLFTSATSPESYFTKGTNASLPVKLIHFNVSRVDDNTVLLNWATVEELNSAKFDIQRSSNGKLWETIGSQLASKVSNHRVEYNYTDFDRVIGTVYYRLKMIDLDGTFSYSNIKTIQSSRTNSIYLYPNPASDRLYLNAELLSVGVQKIKIISLNGTVVYSKSYTDDNFQNELSNGIRIQSLPLGIYVVNVLLNNRTIYSQRVLFKNSGLN